MKRFTLIYLAGALLFLSSCKKDKSDDAYDGVKGIWKFESITVEHINAQGTVYKQKTFDNSYEDNTITIKDDGLYEVQQLAIFLYNATYSFKGEDSSNDHKGIWEFDKDLKKMWFDKGITEYFNSTSGLEFSLKLNYYLEGDKLIFESTDKKIAADFGYNIGEYYFSGLWFDMADNINSEGNSDGYRNGYWNGYYLGAPADDIAIDKDAFYAYWGKGVYENVADTSGIYQYPNYETGYLSGYTTGYNDGFNDAQAVDWNSDKTFKTKIVLKKL